MHMFRRAAALAVLASLLAQAVASADTFRNVKLMVNTGEKAEEQDAVLHFGEDAVTVYGKGGAILKTFKYTDIKGGFSGLRGTNRQGRRNRCGRKVTSCSRAPVVPVPP